MGRLMMKEKLIPQKVGFPALRESVLCLVRSCPSLSLPLVVLLLLPVMIIFIYGVLGSLQVLLGESFCFFASSKPAKSSLLIFMGTTIWSSFLV